MISSGNFRKWYTTAFGEKAKCHIPRTQTTRHAVRLPYRHAWRQRTRPEAKLLSSGTAIGNRRDIDCDDPFGVAQAKCATRMHLDSDR